MAEINFSEVNLGLLKQTEKNEDDSNDLGAASQFLAVLEESDENEILDELQGMRNLTLEVSQNADFIQKRTEELKLVKNQLEDPDLEPLHEELEKSQGHAFDKLCSALTDSASVEKYGNLSASASRFTQAIQKLSAKPKRSRSDKKDFNPGK